MRKFFKEVVLVAYATQCPDLGLVCKPGSPGTRVDGFIPHREKGGETPRESVFLRVADTAI